MPVPPTCGSIQQTLLSRPLLLKLTLKIWSRVLWVGIMDCSFTIIESLFRDNTVATGLIMLGK